MDESQRHCFEQKKLDTHKTKNYDFTYMEFVNGQNYIQCQKSEQWWPIGAWVLTRMVPWEISGVDGQLLKFDWVLVHGLYS